MERSTLIVVSVVVGVVDFVVVSFLVSGGAPIAALLAGGGVYLLGSRRGDGGIRPRDRR